MNSQEELDIVVGKSEGQLRRVEIWVGCERLTGEDCLVFPQAFLHAVQKTADRLIAELNFLRHEGELTGLGIEEAFEVVSTGDLHTSLRIFSWGPTTDDCPCFLLPVQQKLWLAWRKTGSTETRAVRIQPYDLISKLQAVISKLTTDGDG